MDFAFSEEQDLLRSSAREFLDEQCPLDGVPAIVDPAADGSDPDAPGWAEDVWKRLADLGWLDEELELLDHAVVIEEAGYGLLPAPLFSTLALALAAVEDDDELRAAVASGELRLSLAWARAGKPHGLAATDPLDVDDDGRVTGDVVLVPDALSVDAFVVVTTGGLRLVRAADATVTPRETTDRTRRMADVSFDGAASTALPGDAAAVLARIERRALALAAVEAVGVARRALDIAVEYARTREQFGRIIGTYQAVSHQIVDAYAGVELARSLAYWAAWSVATDDEQADVACSAAKSTATEAAVHACERAIQSCGGIGFTWEHVLHRLYKRALWLDVFAGSGREHRRRVADAIL